MSDSRFLAAALIPPRRCLADLPFTTALFRALPEELIPLSEAMAWLMRSLSCSNSATILSIFKVNLLVDCYSISYRNRGSWQPRILALLANPYEHSLTRKQAILN
jgi:hypothetical protein